MIDIKFIINLLKTIVLILNSILIAFGKLFIPKKYLMKSVENKIVLITGAGSGVGAALAVKFAKRKARLVLWDLNSQGLKTTMEECRRYQSESFIFTFQIDICNRDQVMEVAEQVKSEVGFVDILINNAGVVSGKGILELDEKSVTRTFNVNVVSHFWTIQAFLPQMLSRNSGQVVSMASIGGLAGANKLSDYCASKFAAVGLQESLLNEIQSANKPGVNVLTVCPFYINTGMFEGVKTDCPLLPILELDYVVRKIEDAILTNAQILYIPRIIYFMAPLKHLLPVNGFLLLSEFVGSVRSMDSFCGRQ